MNKKLLAYKVSKHPWIKRLSEFVDNKTMARLIVEELMNEDDQDEIKKQFLRFFGKLDDIYEKQEKTPEDKQNFMKILQQLEQEYEDVAEEKDEEFKLPANDLNSLKATIEQYGEKYEEMTKDNEKTQQGGEEQTQGSEESDEGLVAKFSKQVDKLELKDDQKQALKKLLAFIYDEKVNLFEVVDKKVIGLLSRFKDHDEPASKIYSEISRNEKVKKLINTFVAAVKEEQETSKTQNKAQQVVNQAAENAQEDLGDSPTEQQVQQATTQAVEAIVPNASPEVQAKLAQAATEKVIDATGIKPSADIKALEIDEDDKKTFIVAADALQNEFYKKGYKRDQAILVNNLITIMDKIDQQDPDLELAYQPTPEDKKESLREIETVADFDFSEEEMKELRISFRSFLSLVNKTKKALEAFEEKAKKGSVMTSSLKEKFMKLLKRLQNSIALLIKAIRKKAGVSESLNEATKEELIEKWKIVQKAYNKTVEASSAFKEILSGDKPQDVDPEVLLQQAYSSAIELSQYFPSVNPFGKTTGKKAELKRYSDQFTSAIQSVKQDLQYVVNVSKRGAGNKAALSDSIESLEDFSVEIKNIFGVEGPVSGDINPREKAAQGKTTQPTAEPPKTGVKLPNLGNISDQLRKELEGKLDDDDIDVIVQATSKARVDMGQQSSVLPVEEFVDNVMNNPQVQNVVTGNTEQTKAADAVKTVMTQQQDPNIEDKLGREVTAEDLLSDEVEDKYAEVFQNPEKYFYIQDPKENIVKDGKYVKYIRIDSPPVGENQEIYTFTTKDKSQVQVPRVKIVDLIDTVFDKTNPYEVDGEYVNGTAEAIIFGYDLEADATQGVGAEISEDFEEAKSKGQDPLDPNVQADIIDDAANNVAAQTGQDAEEVKPDIEPVVQAKAKEEAGKTASQEDEPQYATTFKDAEERRDVVQGEILKMSEDVRSIDDFQRNAANLFVNQLLFNVSPMNENLTKDLPDYKEQIRKVLTSMGSRKREYLTNFTNNMKKAKKYQKFLKYVKDLLSAAKQQSKQGDQSKSKPQDKKRKSLHDQYKEDVREYSDKEYLIYLRKLIYYVEESASLLTKYDMFSLKPIDEMKRVLKALNDQSEEDIFKNRSEYRSHISILDKASTIEGELATLAIFEGKTDADKTRAKRIQEAIHKTLYTEINNYYKEKKANLKLIEVTPYKTKSEIAMSHSMAISDPRYIEGDKKYNETVALLDKVIIKNASGREMMRDRVDMAFAVANTGYSSGARVYGRK